MVVLGPSQIPQCMHTDLQCANRIYCLKQLKSILLSLYTQVKVSLAYPYNVRIVQ